MAAVANISGMWRAGYVVAGVALASWGLFGAGSKWAIVTWLAIGGGLIVAGIIGFCPVCRLLGRTGQPT